MRYLPSGEMLIEMRGLCSWRQTISIYPCPRFWADFSLFFVDSTSSVEGLFARTPPPATAAPQRSSLSVMRYPIFTRAPVTIATRPVR